MAEADSDGHWRFWRKTKFDKCALYLHHNLPFGLVSESSASLIGRQRNDISRSANCVNAFNSPREYCYFIKWMRGGVIADKRFNQCAVKVENVQATASFVAFCRGVWYTCHRVSFLAR